MGWYSLKEFRDFTIDSKSKPLVTIGICVRNGEDFIGAVIESILCQDFSHELMELIIIDDGSQDATLNVIYSYLSKMSFSVKLFSGRWRGLGAARQTVVQNTRGKYIVWVDSDTILTKTYIKKQAEFMEKHPNVGISNGRCLDYKSIRFPYYNNLVSFLEQMGFLAVNNMVRGKPTDKLPGTAGTIYRFQALNRVGGFDNRITGAGEDMDAAYRVREDGWLIYFDTGGTFYHIMKETWNALWRQYYWHGYGYHYVFHKNTGIGKVYDMLPPVGFLAGLYYSFEAYKLTKRKVVFLMPFHFLFKTTAFFLGFINSHINS